jgi:hypothetical protein
MAKGMLRTFILFCFGLHGRSASIIPRFVGNEYASHIHFLLNFGL